MAAQQFMDKTAWTIADDLEDAIIPTNQAQFSLALAKNAADIVAETRRTTRELSNRTLQMQAYTTNELLNRLKDLNKWKAELENSISEITEESDDLRRVRHKTQLSLGIIEVANRINTESRQVRQKRIGRELGRDRVDDELEKEHQLMSDVIAAVQNDLLTMQQQLDADVNAKTQLELDWSNKKEAADTDHRSAALANGSPEAMYKPGAGRFLETMSQPEQWQSHTIRNLNAAAEQRMLTRNLIRVVSDDMKNFAKLLREQADLIDACLVDSVRKLVEERLLIQQQIRDKEKESHMIEKAIEELKQLMKVKDAPLKVALTRPGVELCNDSPHQALLDELAVLQDSMEKLKRQLESSQEAARRLEAERLQLERRVRVVEHNTQLDSDILRNIRSLFPVAIKLTGFSISLQDNLKT